MDNVIDLQSISKRYVSPADSGAIEVLKRIDLRIGEGESVAIVGPSGSGKSTLLNVMGGLDVPDEGKVLVGGRDLAELSARERARIRNTEIGFVFQLHHLLPQCTAVENVLVPTLAENGRRSKETVERAEDLLDKVGLSNRLDHAFATAHGRAFAQ